MRRFTIMEIVIAAALVGSAISAATCILPGSLVRSYAEWSEKRTPEAYEAWQRETRKGASKEHAEMAAELAIAFAAALGCFNFFLPKRPTSPASRDGALPAVGSKS
jgi:hypothetical protein